MSTASRLNARPEPQRAVTTPAAGVHRLDMGTTRDGWLFVPPGLTAARPAPLLVSLHGAGGQGRSALSPPLLERAGQAGMLVLAPDSRGPTWDVILGGFGPDVAFIDAALDHVFERFAVDPRRTILSGFSDGASYALSLGVGNGDVFSHIVGFSPGFMAPDASEGQPPIFISHGVHDRVLSIDHCSRQLVPLLERAGYAVEYVEFDGGHEVPPAIVEQAVRWVAQTSAPT